MKNRSSIVEELLNPRKFNIKNTQYAAVGPDQGPSIPVSNHALISIWSDATKKTTVFMKSFTDISMLSNDNPTNLTLTLADNNNAIVLSRKSGPLGVNFTVVEWV